MRFQSDLKIELVARNELGAIVASITPDGVVDAQIASAQIARGDATYVTGPDSFVRVPVRSISALGGAYLYANWGWLAAQQPPRRRRCSRADADVGGVCR